MLRGLSVYLSLGEFAGSLVLAVAKKFDDAALVGGEAVVRR
jgi:hypothetical protein